MNQGNGVSTYGLKETREDQTTDEKAEKEQASRKQGAGDSSPENDDDSNPTVIAARPVASGGFSTSSVSEEFLKELKQIGTSFEQSRAKTKMLEDDMKDNDADKEAEVAPSGGDKDSKEVSNRLLKFQITAPQAAPARSRCTAGHGRCDCRKKKCRNQRASGKAHDDGHRVSKSRSGSRPRRHRHRSASSAVDRREMRTDERPAVQKHPDGGSVTHRRQRHHHYRHQRRMRDGDFSDRGAQPASTVPEGHRRCCRSPAASDSCCFRTSVKHASEGDHHRRMGAEEDGDAQNGAQQSRGGRKSEKRSKASGENGTTNQADGKCGDVFSRYRSNYRSVDTGSSSSSSSSENECVEKVAATRRKREGDCPSTFTFTHTRESSSPIRSRRKSRAGSRDRSRSSSKRRCADGPVESTVEKHVLELNFPPSPMMRSISNLLKLHCPCQENVENKEDEDNVDDEGDGDEEENNEDSTERFVHRMKPGQTCELQGDSQVILVSLPEPHKLTVEHVIRSSSSLVEKERCISRHREKAERGCVERDRKIYQRKSGTRCEETVDTPRFRRKHSYVRHTRRLKGLNACQDDPAPPKTVNQCSSSSSDSSEDDEPNDLPYSKEKGTEEVVVRPVIKSSRHNRGGGREEFADGRSSTQRELRVTIPKVGSGETSRNRSSGLRKTKRSSKASSADSEARGDKCGEGAGEDNTLRIVFTDSRLNTELRCILQERSNPSREGRRDPGRTPHPQRRSGGPRDTRRQQVNARKASEDNTDTDSARGSTIRRQHCGCAPMTQRQRSRHGGQDSDVVSSSYYSSTHESSVALNEATKAGSGCTLCHTIRAMSAKERPWRRNWQRSKHAHR
ncbi:nucleolar and coiled-body phosphoprotein 1-like [Dermacentor albipictus]|uniref:nucleolar and coiled-body phosphoprotein 1-like n=1 Tax=Dermacentor albipictus TaxID=60249 RepID=UPI0031FC9774